MKTNAKGLVGPPQTIELSSDSSLDASLLSYSLLPLPSILIHVILKHGESRVSSTALIFFLFWA